MRRCERTSGALAVGALGVVWRRWGGSCAGGLVKHHGRQFLKHGLESLRCVYKPYNPYLLPNPKGELVRQKIPFLYQGSPPLPLYRPIHRRYIQALGHRRGLVKEISRRRRTDELGSRFASPIVFSSPRNARTGATQTYAICKLRFKRARAHTHNAMKDFG